MMRSGVYEILNAVNGKVYIGSAVNFKKRRAGHLYHLRRNTHRNPHLQCAWNKYGEDSFLFLPVEHVVLDKNELVSREQFWIDALNACDRAKGYNISPTAGSQLGLVHSEKTRLKMSLAHKGHETSDETRAKISKAQKGQKRSPHSAETKQKMSETHRVLGPNDGTFMAGQVPWNKGKRASEESRRKMSEAHMGLISGNKGKRGNVPWNKGESHSIETLAKMSRAARNISDKTRAKMKEGQRRRRLREDGLKQEAVARCSSGGLE